MSTEFGKLLFVSLRGGGGTTGVSKALQHQSSLQPCAMSAEYKLHTGI